MADAHTYKFNVTMSCGGCSGAINRVLGKLEGALSSPLSPPVSTTLQAAFWSRSAEYYVILFQALALYSTFLPIYPSIPFYADISPDMDHALTKRLTVLLKTQQVSRATTSRSRSKKPSLSQPLVSTTRPCSRRSRRRGRRLTRARRTARLRALSCPSKCHQGLKGKENRTRQAWYWDVRDTARSGEVQDYGVLLVVLLWEETRWMD